MRNQYIIKGKQFIKTDNEDEQANQEWQPLDIVHSKTKAIKQAEKISKIKYWYEVRVYCRPDDGDDPIFDAYYQNGKMKFSMV